MKSNFKPITSKGPRPEVETIHSAQAIKLFKQSTQTEIYYVFGGIINGRDATNKIMKLEKGFWFHAGNLVFGRNDHSVIMIDKRVFILGGPGKSNNEVCSFPESSIDKVDCVLVGSYELVNFRRPTLFLNNECNKVEEEIEIYTSEVYVPDTKNKGRENLIILTLEKRNDINWIYQESTKNDSFYHLETPKASFNLDKSCSVVYKDELYIYG